MFQAIRCCLLLLLVRFARTQIIEETLNYPPMFVNLPPQTNLTAVQRSTLQLPCQARARPGCIYIWFHNDHVLSQSWLGGKVTYDSNVGTLSIMTNENTVGRFFCRAISRLTESNSTVRAITQSETIHLQMAYGEAFPDHPLVTYKVRRGDYALFRCSHPTFVPNAFLHWRNLDKIEIEDARFFVEPDNGDLHILSSTDGSEAQPGLECCATNKVNGMTSCGSDQRVELSDETPLSFKPTLRFRTNSAQATFNEGDQAASIACAFSANPLATVEWRRTDNLPVSGTPDARRNYDTLRFASVTRQLAATYQCRGSNTLGVTQWYDINVTVRTYAAFARTFEQAISVLPLDNGSTPIVLPMWQPSTLPGNIQVGLVNASVGDTVTLDCTCVGDPKPTVTWTLNSVATQDLDSTVSLYKRMVEQLNGKMIVRAVEQSDKGNVLSCQCANVVGSVMRIFGLMVFERTRIVERPQASNFTPIVTGYRPANEANTLVMDLDERGAANAQQMRERSALRCGARSDASTRLSVDWWNAGRDTPVASLGLDETLDTQAAKRTQLVTDGNTGDDADWLIGATKQQSNGIQTAIAKFNMQKLVEVAWERRERQSLYRMSLECRATNTLSRDNLKLNVVFNATAYIRARLAALQPQGNGSAEVDVVLDVVKAPVEASLENWWIILVAALCAFIVLVIVLVTVYCARRNRGASYPLEKHELATGRDPLGELRASGFSPLIRQNDVVKGRLFESLEQALAGDLDDAGADRTKTALLDDDDAFVNEYERGDTGKFSPDGAALNLVTVNRGASMHRPSVTPQQALPVEVRTEPTSSPDRSLGYNTNGTLPMASNRSSVERTNAVAVAEPRYNLVTFTAGNNNRHSGSQRASANANLNGSPDAGSLSCQFV